MQKGFNANITRKDLTYFSRQTFSRELKIVYINRQHCYRHKEGHTYIYTSDAVILAKAKKSQRVYQTKSIKETKDEYELESMKTIDNEIEK